jgi:hypothetical protein
MRVSKTTKSNISNDPELYSELERSLLRKTDAVGKIQL